MGAVKCTCDTAHVEKVELSPLHILGPGTFWRAAKPGGYYLVEHGNHFFNEQDANDYAFGGGGDADPA